jgi:dienelactone hydrolase
LASVGPALFIEPFDKYARRRYEMQTSDGVLSVVQGITELTPRYAKVEALMGPKRTVAWDSRIATSSIPKETLATILATAIPQDDPQARLQAVRFYVQAKRFQEARAELARIIAEFPEMQGLASEEKQLRQMGARTLLDEIELRRKAGQHQLTAALLASFPTDDVTGETLVRVREMASVYEQEDARIKNIGEAIKKVVTAIEDPDHRGLAAPVVEEIARELSHNTVDRLAPFVQLMDDPEITAEDKAALAISGWLLGGNKAEKGLTLALSLLKARDSVLRYLNESLAGARQEIANDSQMRAEGVSVARLAEIISHMRPPKHDVAILSAPGGYLELSASGHTEDGDFNYVVQLPPEYDPYRRYPTIIALNGAYNSAVQELDFWAGSPPPADAKGRPTARRGQAMRNGYIVVAVDWQKPHQYAYEFSSREHVAVLTVLRDAMRRLSIDTDRVYLTGHDIGGQAAWDLAQAHPDLWAGVVPFTAAVGDKYIRHYWENGQYVPSYFVGGELDGRRVQENASVWDKYLRTPKFDATVVEYKGRGHEPFHDEILAIFDWMGRKTRQFPDEFECHTLRPWDNFYWWLECRDFNETNMMHPTDWAPRAARPARIEGRRQPDNRLLAKASAGTTTIWLGPEFVDFSKPIRVTYNNRKASGDGEIAPDAGVLLEDVRTRGDRQHPFWAKIETR